MCVVESRTPRARAVVPLFLQVIIESNRNLTVNFYS